MLKIASSAMESERERCHQRNSVEPLTPATCSDPAAYDHIQRLCMIDVRVDSQQCKHNLHVLIRMDRSVLQLALHMCNEDLHLLRLPL